MITSPAYTNLTGVPIDGTFPGADITDGEMLVSLSDAPHEFTILKEMLISWNIGGHS